LPYDFNDKAPYTILEETKTGYNVIEKRVQYDIGSVIHYTKSSALYEINRNICELTFLDLQTGSNNVSLLLDIALEIAAAKNEDGDFYRIPFSNATWAEAGERFITQYGV
jgi:hypothetical protein